MPSHEVHPVTPSFRRRHSPLALILAILLVCDASFAQTNSSDWTSLETLPPDCAVTVRTRTGGKYHGELVRVSTDALALDSDEKASPGRAVRRREFRREEIQEVRLLAPTTSIIAGAAIGAGAGAGLGIGLDATAKSHEYRGLIAGVLALLGAGIGAAIAHHNPFIKGRVVYRVG
jgi:hypothetical protein